MQDSRREEFAVDALARTVADVEPHLKDYLEVAVVLESLGYTDRYAQSVGYPNLFELAKDVYPVVEHYVWEDPFDIQEPVRKRQSGIRLFLIGTFYNIGWVIMLIALFLGGQSLWAAKDLPVETSTSIGLGVLLGLVSTGGAQQFSALKLIYYYTQKNKPIARFVMGRSLILGSEILIGTVLGFVILNSLFLHFPSSMVALVLYYTLFIGAYRLAVAPVFALRNYVILITISAVSLAVMFAAYQILILESLARSTAVIISQSLGLLTLLTFSAFFLYVTIFRDRVISSEDEPPFYSRPEEPRNVRPPVFSVLVYEGIYYILYGTLYFVFLFGDRLISWLGGPLGLTYNNAYQIGVDVALLLLIPITGVKFTFIYRLSSQLEKSLKRTRTKSLEVFRRDTNAFYRSMMMTVLLVAFGLIIISSFGAGHIVAYLGGNQDSAWVFKWALLGIFFFSVFLTNALFLLAFHRTKEIVMILLVGTILNYLFSYIFSTAMGSYLTVFGFLMSSAFLCAASIALSSFFLRKSDYAYYSAF